MLKYKFIKKSIQVLFRKSCFQPWKDSGEKKVKSGEVLVLNPLEMIFSHNNSEPEELCEAGASWKKFTVF